MVIDLSPYDDEFKNLKKDLNIKRQRETTLASVKRRVAIHSGKGGVGKTFMTVNVAYALAERGYQVGILDADVDCPNIPKFLGITASMRVDQDKKFIPINHQGVKIVSMGLTRDDEGEPFLIRGPAKHRIAIDLLTNTNWGALDFLIIDLPPGTADVPMSLLEFGKVEEILYVTSPQKDSLMDTRKSIEMGRQFGIHATGIVENMSGGFFGTGKALSLAEETGIPLVGTVPLDKNILSMNERGDIAFTDVDFEEVSKPIVDAIIANLESRT